MLPSRQGDDALEMARLWEEVEGLHGCERVAGGEKTLQVAHLGGRVARHIDDGARTEGKELREEGFIATLARRVDDHRGISGREIQAGEDLRGIAGAESGVGDGVGRSVLSGEPDRG